MALPVDAHADTARARGVEEAQVQAGRGDDQCKSNNASTVATGPDAIRRPTL
jgi:hypothetical protein